MGIIWAISHGHGNFINNNLTLMSISNKEFIDQFHETSKFGSKYVFQYARKYLPKRFNVTACNNLFISNILFSNPNYDLRDVHLL